MVVVGFEGKRYNVDRKETKRKGNEYESFCRNYDTVCRDDAWLGMCVFLKRGNETAAEKKSSGICFRGDGGSVGVVTFDSVYGNVGGDGKDGFHSGSGGAPSGDGISSGDGPDHSTSSSGQ